VRKANPRPIPLDEARVARVAQHFAHGLDRVLARLPQHEPLAESLENRFLDPTLLEEDVPGLVTRVRGGDATVRLVFVSSARPAVPFARDLVAAQAQRFVVDGTPLLDVVILFVQGLKTPAQLREGIATGSLGHQAEELLAHELRHIAQHVRRSKAKPVSRTFRNYVNGPRELEARIGDVVAEVRRSAAGPGLRDAIARGAFPSRRALFQALLATSSTWKDLEKHLSEANQRRILRAVYTEVEPFLSLQPGRQQNPRTQRDLRRALTERMTELTAQLELFGDAAIEAPAFRKLCEEIDVPCRISKDGEYALAAGEFYRLPFDPDIDEAQDPAEFVAEADEADAANFGVVIPDLTTEFWAPGNPPPELYHATTPDNVAGILKQGLGVRSKTRGISNRSVGAAIFTSTELSDLEGGEYGDAIFQIDTAAMQRDGVTPPLSLEPDEEEREWKEALASKLGVEDFVFESEAGMSPNTIVVYGHIPAKYLTLLDEG